MEPTIAQELEKAFRASPYHQLRAVHCRFHDDILTLEGTVPSYYLKQQAQALAQSLASASEVKNEIQVISPQG